MASIRKRQSGGRTRWQVRWRQGGQSKAETFDTEKKAIKFRGLVDASDQRYPDGWVPGVGFLNVAEVAASDRTLASWFDDCMEARPKANARTRLEYARDFTNHVPRWLATKPIDEITQHDVRRWLTELQDTHTSMPGRAHRKLSPKTIHNIHGMVSSVMKAAQDDGLITRNPFKGQVTSVPIKQEDMVFLSPAEFVTFRRFVIPQYHPFVDFLFGTGLRFGEATALMPHHLELGSKRLHVQTAWKKQVDNSMLSLDPKSRRSRRTLSLTDRQVELLRELVAPGELVFRNVNGGRIVQSSFHNHVWTPALRRAADAGFPKRPRPHDLRHSHASVLLSMGTPLLAVSRRLGHESIQTTNDRYGHLLPEVDQSMLDALGQVGL